MFARAQKLIIVLAVILTASSCASVQLSGKQLDKNSVPYELVIQDGHHKWIWDLAWSQDGKIIATSSGDGSVKFWTPDLRLIRTVKIASIGDIGMKLSLSRDGTKVACRTGQGDYARYGVWDIYGNCIAEYKGEILDIKFVPDGTILMLSRLHPGFSKEKGFFVELFNSEGKFVKRLVTMPDQSFYNPDLEKLTILKDGKHFAVRRSHYNPYKKTETFDWMIFSMDGTLIHRKQGSEKGLILCLSPDGVHCIPPVNNRILTLYDSSFVKKESILLPSDTVRYIQFSPDNKYLAYIHSDSSIHSNYTIYLCTRNGKFIRKIDEGKKEPVSTIAWSPDSSKIATLRLDENKIKIWDVQTGNLAVMSPPSISHNIKNFTVDATSSALACITEKKISWWNLKTASRSWSIPHPKNQIYSGSFCIMSPNGDRAAYRSDDCIHLITNKGISNVKLIDSDAGQFWFNPDGTRLLAMVQNKRNYSLNMYNSDGTLLRKMILDNKLLSNEDSFLFFPSPDWKTFVTAYQPSSISKVSKKSSSIVFWNSDGKQIKALSLPMGHSSIAFAPDFSCFATGFYGQTIYLWGLDGKLLRTVNGPSLNDRDAQNFKITNLTFNADGSRIIASGSQEVYYDKRLGGIRPINQTLWDVQQGRFLDTAELLSMGRTHSGCANIFSPDGSYIISYIAGEKELKILDRNGIFQRTIVPFRSGFSGVRFSLDGRYLIALFPDTSIRLYNLKTQSTIALLEDQNEWAVWNDQGYFDGSRYCGRLIGMSRGTAVFGIDQFALHNNRPDLILKNAEIGSTEAIAHYESQYMKRLKRWGITGTADASDYTIPSIAIDSFTQDFSRSNGKYATIVFTMNAKRFGLLYYQIYVNDVPVYGPRGKSTSGKRASARETIELSPGKNKIEITCFNTRGMESFRAMKNIHYEKKSNGNLYFLGFGVSEYRDKSLTLKYAHQDVLDLASAFKKLARSYNSVFIKTYINEEVTPDSITAAKEFISSAGIDDTVVLFIAGHGIHDTDRESTYYYLTSISNPSDLRDTAVTFNRFEMLLSATSARHKLFLMDTCESGEAEEDDAPASIGASSKGTRARTSRALVITLKKKNKGRPRDFLRIKDRYLYNDLFRRTGAIVVSSSRGNELSYESDVYKNGLFTEALLSALQGKAGKGSLSVKSMVDYVSKRVPVLSEGKQHPTVDRDNLYVDFVIPVKP